MRSFFTGDGSTPAFRTSWRGYDRAEVDAFLRQTAADRQRLQEDLAQLEAFTATSGDERREVERLAAIRREVASCLETSIGALRTATGLMASVTPPAAQPAPPPIHAISERLYRRSPVHHVPARFFPAWHARAEPAGAAVVACRHTKARSRRRGIRWRH